LLLQGAAGCSDVFCRRARHDGQCLHMASEDNMGYVYNYIRLNAFNESLDGFGAGMTNKNDLVFF
jgi:hypothetical protein